MMPFFLFALYERNGLPLEKYLLYFVRACFIRPKQRPYMTNNFYAALEKQDELDREVHRIVHRKTYGVSMPDSQAAMFSGRPSS